MNFLNMLFHILYYFRLCLYVSSEYGNVWCCLCNRAFSCHQLIDLDKSFFNPKHQLHFHFQRNCISFRSLQNIISLGISSFINEFSSGIVLIIFSLLILKYTGNTGVATYGIVANLSLISVAVFTGSISIYFPCSLFLFHRLYRLVLSSEITPSKFIPLSFGIHHNTLLSSQSSYRYVLQTYRQTASILAPLLSQSEVRVLL